MVQTYQSPVRVYKHPFELVMAAYERRFPTCPQIPIFVGSEILSEYKSEDGAEHVVERKCKLNPDAPYILKKIAGIDYVYFAQKNALDRRKRTLTIEAENMTFSSRVVVVEKCFYYVHPENTDWTCFEQNASLDVKSFFGFEASVEKLAMKQYSQNIQKGKEIIEYYINELIQSGAAARIPPPMEPRGEAAAVLTTRRVSSVAPATHDSPSVDSAICVSESTSRRNGDLEESIDSAIVVEPSTMRRSMRRRRSGAGVDADDGTKVVGSRSRSGTIVKQPLTAQLSADDADSKLETEYIHRFLGDLSPLEESRLCELRYSLQTSHKGKLPNDAHLLRFLRARDFDVQRAREMLVASIMWRKQHQVDKILMTYQPTAVVLQFFPGAWHHHDLEGRPVFLLRLGQLDIKGLLKAVGQDGIVKFVLSICEEGLCKCEEATVQFGKPISSWTLLVDLEGLSMRHLWRPGIRLLLRLIEIAEANYPETMGRALIVRAPRVFPVLWTLVGPLIDENTRRKFFIYGGNDYTDAGGLADYIDAKHVPDFLGGRCFSLAQEGGLVPKSLYTTAASADDDEAPKSASSPGDDAELLESLYQKGYVYRGLPLEVLQPVAEKGCVLTWDFDIARGECEFVLLRTSKLVEIDEAQNAQSPSLTSLGPSGIVAAAMSASRPVAFDKTLELGVDLFVEEKGTRCREGDSMQGSHYCAKPGTYIMQWRSVPTTDPPPHASSHTFDLSLAKAKVVYYFEVLNSADFRGSMASIESCRSSFSSLSFGNLTPNSSTCHRINVQPDAPSCSRTPSTSGGRLGEAPTFTVGNT